jgi:uncharacterized protein YkwD
MSHLRFSFWRLLLAAAFTLCYPTENAVAQQQLKEFDGKYLNAPRGGPDLARAEQELFRLTNELREKHGRPRLVWNKSLWKPAAYLAAYMARADKYGHEADGNTPAERLTAFQYDYCMEAENIAYQTKSSNFSTGELAQKFFETWRDSPPHHANMLDPDMTEVGIAIGYSPASNRYYAVQSFGRPQSAAIDFVVANRTEEIVRYTVQTGEGRGNADAEPIELPPHSTMWHEACQRSTIDWGWTKADDRVVVADKREFVVEKSGPEFRVSQQKLQERQQASAAGNNKR